MVLAADVEWMGVAGKEGLAAIDGDARVWNGVIGSMKWSLGMPVAMALMKLGAAGGVVSITTHGGSRGRGVLGRGG